MGYQKLVPGLKKSFSTVSQGRRAAATQPQIEVLSLIESDIDTDKGLAKRRTLQENIRIVKRLKVFKSAKNHSELQGALDSKPDSM